MMRKKTALNVIDALEFIENAMSYGRPRKRPSKQHRPVATVIVDTDGIGIIEVEGRIPEQLDLAKVDKLSLRGCFQVLSRLHKRSVVEWTKWFMICAGYGSELRPNEDYSSDEYRAWLARHWGNGPIAKQIEEAGFKIIEAEELIYDTRELERAARKARLDLIRRYDT